MFQNVFIVGTGNVGKETVRQIYSKGDTDPRHDNPTRIVGLANRHGVLFRPNGIGRDAAENFLKGLVRDEARMEPEQLLQLPKERTVFIDLTASDHMLPFHRKVILDTEHCIVTANKKPLVQADTKTFRQITHMRSRYGYRCSVMAGADAVYELQYLVDLNEPILMMEGALSGTLSYIASNLQVASEVLGPMMKLSEAVEDAYRRKYMEPDIRDDLRGTDAIRKMVILGRSAGMEVEMGDALATSFVPENYLQSEKPAEIISGLKFLDESFSEQVAKNEEIGLVPRYLLTLDMLRSGRPTVRGGLEWAHRNGPFGTLRNTENRLLVSGGIPYPENTIYDSTPIAGAGVERTARNIRRDLIDLLRDRKIAFSSGLN